MNEKNEKTKENEEIMEEKADLNGDIYPESKQKLCLEIPRKWAKLAKQYHLKYTQVFFMGLRAYQEESRFKEEISLLKSENTRMTSNIEKFQKKITYLIRKYNVSTDDILYMPRVE